MSYTHRTIATGAYRAMKEAGRDPNYADTAIAYPKLLNKPRSARSRSQKTCHRQYILEFGCGVTCQEHPPARPRNEKRLTEWQKSKRGLKIKAATVGATD